MSGVLREREILKKDYLRSVTDDVGLLTERMRDAHLLLRQTRQDELPSGLERLAEQIVEKEVLNCPDSKELRLLAACCACDVLRIYAPEAPYSEEQLELVMDAVTAQLHSLAQIGTGVDEETRNYERAFYILESLAKVKSAALVSQQCAARGEYSKLHSLFDAILDSLRPLHSGKARAYAADVITVCLEELGALPEDVAEAILRRVLPEYEEEHGTGWEIALEVVRRLPELFRPALTAIMEHALASGVDGTGDGDGDGEEDGEEEEGELKGFRAFGSLVLNLAAHVGGGLLLSVMPRLEAELVADTAPQRVRAIGLMGDLLSDPEPPAGSTMPLVLQYPTALTALLDRLIDVEARARLEACVQVGRVLESISQLLERQPVQDALRLRLGDSEAAVRLSAVKAVAQGLLQVEGSGKEAEGGGGAQKARISKVDMQLLEAIGARVRDKNAAVRNIAATTLAQLWLQHVVPLWSSLSHSGDSASFSLLDPFGDFGLAPNPSHYEEGDAMGEEGEEGSGSVDGVEDDADADAAEASMGGEDETVLAASRRKSRRSGGRGKSGDGEGEDEVEKGGGRKGGRGVAVGRKRGRKEKRIEEKEEEEEEGEGEEGMAKDLVRVEVRNEGVRAVLLRLWWVPDVLLSSWTDEGMQQRIQQLVPRSLLPFLREDQVPSSARAFGLGWFSVFLSRPARSALRQMWESRSKAKRALARALKARTALRSRSRASSASLTDSSSSSAASSRSRSSSSSPSSMAKLKEELRSSLWELARLVRVGVPRGVELAGHCGASVSDAHVLATLEDAFLRFSDNGFFDALAPLAQSPSVSGEALKSCRTRALESARAHRDLVEHGAREHAQERDGPAAGVRGDWAKSVGALEVVVKVIFSHCAFGPTGDDATYLTSLLDTASKAVVAVGPAAGDSAVALEATKAGSWPPRDVLESEDAFDPTTSDIFGIAREQHSLADAATGVGAGAAGPPESLPNASSSDSSTSSTACKAERVATPLGTVQGALWALRTIAETDPALFSLPEASNALLSLLSSPLPESLLAALHTATLALPYLDEEIKDEILEATTTLATSHTDAQVAMEAAKFLCRASSSSSTSPLPTIPTLASLEEIAATSAGEPARKSPPGSKGKKRGSGEMIRGEEEAVEEAGRVVRGMRVAGALAESGMVVEILQGDVKETVRKGVVLASAPSNLALPLARSENASAAATGLACSAAAALRAAGLSFLVSRTTGLARFIIRNFTPGASTTTTTTSSSSSSSTFSSREEAMEELRRSADETTRTLLGVLQRGGDPARENVSEDDAGLVRLTAVSQLGRLLGTLPEQLGVRVMSNPLRWVACARACHAKIESDPIVRAATIRPLQRLAVSRPKLAASATALLSLVAVDPERPIRNAARTALHRVLKTNTQAFKAATSSSSSASSSAAARPSPWRDPVSPVLVLCYILARLPSFPPEAAWVDPSVPLTRTFAAQIDVQDCLISAIADADRSALRRLQPLLARAAKCDDAQTESTTSSSSSSSSSSSGRIHTDRLRVSVQMAAVVVRGKVKHAGDVSLDKTGPVPLPTALFRAGKQRQGASVDVVAQAVEEAASATSAPGSAARPALSPPRALKGRGAPRTGRIAPSTARPTGAKTRTRIMTAKKTAAATRTTARRKVQPRRKPKREEESESESESEASSVDSFVQESKRQEKRASPARRNKRRSTRGAAASAAATE